MKRTSQESETKGMWIYQLAKPKKKGRWEPEWYEPKKFRSYIREGKRKRWPYGDKKDLKKLPAKGDTLVFFYAPTGQMEPGIYGWATVVKCDKEDKKVEFIPKTPTDDLKMVPWWDKHTEKLLTEIRRAPNGAFFPMGTLFRVPEKKTTRAIREGIKFQQERLLRFKMAIKKQLSQ